MDVLFEMEPTVLASIAQKPGGCIPITHEEHLRLTAIAADHCDPVRWVGSGLSAQLPGQLLLAAVETILPGCRLHGQLAADSCHRLARRSAPILVSCRIPGGSAANVMKGVANLSAGRVCCKFVGMVGTDATAEAYRRKMEQQGVQPVLLVRLFDCRLSAVSFMCRMDPLWNRGNAV
jgi:hypothetical protein